MILTRQIMNVLRIALSRGTSIASGTSDGFARFVVIHVTRHL